MTNFLLAVFLWLLPAPQIITLVRGSGGGVCTPVSAGRTLWLRADVATNLFESYGPPGATNPSDTDPVQSWQDEDGLSNIYFIYPATGGTEPLWRSSGIGSGGVLDFDGTDDRLRSWNDAVSAQQPLSNLVSVSAKTLIVVLRMQGAATNNANIYDNTAIFSDIAYALFGLYFKTDTGVHTAYAFNWDGDADSVGVTMSLDTDHVIQIRHNGTNLYISVDGGSESSVASGNTSSLPADGYISIGANYAVNRFFNGQVAELFAYNTDLGASNDTLTCMLAKY